MKIFYAIATLLSLAPTVAAQSPYAPQFAREGFATQAALPTAARPVPAHIHPSVARIVAPGDGSISYGSGTLVLVTEKHGLVITNWHVVNEAVGPVTVVFPDGFQSQGRVQKVDRDWDLAAIVIWRPRVQPVTLSAQPPRPGEVLTIAGYGSGKYRAVSGRCTQYVAPGRNLPYEMVELAASARQGDSGGPMLNARGELAGVLFGTGGGRTSGSYCGRVRTFLADFTPATSPLDQPPLVARNEPPTRLPMVSTPYGMAPDRAFAHRAAPPIIAAPMQVAVERPAPATVAQSETFTHEASTRIAPLPEYSVAPSLEKETAPQFAAVAPDWRPQVSSGLSPAAQRSQYVGWKEIAGETRGEQAKTVLAALGLLGLLLRVLRWLSETPPQTSKA